MSHLGQPDFGALEVLAGCSVAPGFSEEGTAWVFPGELVLANRPDGTPHFRLSLIRPANPMLPPAPHGQLELGLKPNYALALVEAELLRLSRALRLEPALPQGGWLAWTAVDVEASGLPAELLTPTRLDWQQFGAAQLALHLSLVAADYLRAALEQRVLVLGAEAALEWVGVAARWPLTLELDPAHTRQVLGERVGADGWLSRAALELALLEPESLGLRLTPAKGPSRELASCLADHLTALFSADPRRRREGEPSEPGLLSGFLPTASLGAAALPSERDPRPATLSVPGLELLPAERFLPGRLSLDLTTPRTTWRRLCLRADPLSAVRGALESGQAHLLLPPPVLVPPLATGFEQIEVRSAWPSPCRGLVSAGVMLAVPAAPPLRPQPATASAELPAGGGALTLPLRLLPAEPLRYSVETFVLLDTGLSKRRLRGAKFLAEGPRLRLSVDDLPIECLLLEARSELLELAQVRGVLHYPAGELTVELTSDAAQLALALPRAVGPTRLELEVSPLGPGRAIPLVFEPARSLSLGLNHLPSHGPQTVQLETRFDGPGGLLALEFALEDQAPDVAPAAVLTLTSERPQRTWTYLPPSPFRAGFRFRRRANPGEAPAAWSDLLVAPRTLTLPQP
jgi:hypothetical protein